MKAGKRQVRFRLRSCHSQLPNAARSGAAACLTEEGRLANSRLAADDRRAAAFEHIGQNRKLAIAADETQIWRELPAWIIC